MFRRKRLPAELESAFAAFHDVVDELEPAKAGLADVVPGSRLPGRPLRDALTELVTRADRAADLMPRWRRPELEPLWSSCSAGLAAARADAQAMLRDASEPAGFGELLGSVEGLMDRLEPFAEAEAHFAQLRRR